MSSSRDAQALVQRVFASLAPPDATLCWRDDVTAVVTVGAEQEGFSIDLEDRPEDLKFKAADRLQSIIIEATRSMVPICPLHPGQHPLSSGVVNGAAIWRCPKTGTSISEVN